MEQIARIDIRLSKEEKDILTKKCSELGCNYTEFVISKIKDEVDYSTKKSIFDFIRKDDYFYSKVDNNINQIAKIVNAEKQISNNLLQQHNELMSKLYSLSKEKSDIIFKIYNLLSK
ncbi:DUF1778 domain-containing protein [Chryseobacterium antibioticum]|uniref:DUF1778 domain-containing protein n=1 Tax=Chryseobacterium pyrolae TaxID=2987481 RepID=A0ABT2INA3_9FLAO|nr:DUF1778 domain-containing protein [Chryseobacterium pyrolae]MCT2409982.1 DUF1778 domain-containing protein [Chryseobacterium pyrolae]